jgi:hypothetical protein
LDEAHNIKNHTSLVAQVCVFCQSCMCFTFRIFSGMLSSASIQSVVFVRYTVAQ